MDRAVRIRTFTAQQRDRWAGGWRWAASRPGWVVRLAAVTFLVLVALPLLFFLGVAILAAAVVFAAVGIGAALASKVRSLFPRRDGRVNVRVIRRQEY